MSKWTKWTIGGAAAVFLALVFQTVRQDPAFADAHNKALAEGNNADKTAQAEAPNDRVMHEYRQRPQQDRSAGGVQPGQRPDGSTLQPGQGEDGSQAFRGRGGGQPGQGYPSERSRIGSGADNGSTGGSSSGSTGGSTGGSSGGTSTQPGLRQQPQQPQTTTPSAPTTRTRSRHS